MHVRLINFGDALRVIHNAANEAVAIPIGEYRDVTLAGFIYNFIRDAMKRGDTLVMMPVGTDFPTELEPVVDLLRVVDTAPYDELVQKAHGVIGNDSIGLRPTRTEVRQALRAICNKFVLANFVQMEQALEQTRDTIVPERESETHNKVAADAEPVVNEKPKRRRVIQKRETKTAVRRRIRV